MSLWEHVALTECEDRVHLIIEDYYWTLRSLYSNAQTAKEDGQRLEISNLGSRGIALSM